MNSGAKVYLGSTYASIPGSTKISEPTWDNEAKKIMWNGHPIFKYGFVDHLDKDDDNEGILESKTDGHEDGDGILNIYDKDDDNDGIPDFLSLLLSFNLPPNLRDFLSFYIIFHF